MTDSPHVFREPHPGLLVAPPTCSLLVVPGLLDHLRIAAFHSGPLVVDLSSTTHVDAAVVRTLLWAGQQFASTDREFAVVMPVDGVLSAREDRLLRSSLPVLPAGDLTVSPGD